MSNPQAIGRYNEQDICESACAFTGWNSIGTGFSVDGERHDDGREAGFDGVQAIGLILAQPATADCIAGRIYRYFVRDEMSPPMQQGRSDFDEVLHALGQQLPHPTTGAGWTYGKAWITPAC